MVIFVYKKSISTIVLLAVFSSAIFLTWALSVGVKAGDWIEYDVTSSGVDPTHDITAARMTVMDVQDSIIQVNIVSTYSNGSTVSTDSTLNLDTGDLIDNFIIPADLTTGMEFNSRTGNMGRMMISDSRQGSYCGATRTVVTATSGGNTYIWDRTTGVSVEGFSEGTLNGQSYNMHSLATSTNMWQTQAQAPLDMTFVYVSVIVVVVIVVVAVVVFAIRRSKK